MKTFLSTVKGKIVAALITTALVVAVIVAIVLMNSGYRTIAVEEINGSSVVVNEGVSKDAFVGQHLKSGDDVTVNDSSDMTLALDTDKYVYAREKTHFWIEATGKSNDSRTKIHLSEGSTLCRIDNKLADSECFDVDTPNATMSVRGTVFRVATHQDSEFFYTEIDVLEGEVYVQVKMETGENTEESRLLKAGEHAVVRSNKDISEFIKSDDDFDYDPDNDNGTALRRIDNVITTIEYSSFTQQEAYFLGKSIDEGRSLSISKDLLYDVVEIIEHDFSGKREELAASCDSEGYYYDVCVICGADGDKHIIEKPEHEYVSKSDDDSMLVCKNCGYEAEADEVVVEEETEEVTKEDSSKKDDKTASNEKNTKDAGDNSVSTCANGHAYEIISKVEAGCNKKGETTYKCSRCGDSYKEEIKALGHDWVTSSQEATCTSEGNVTKTCKRCGEKNVTTTSALGHNYSTSHADATCTSDGYDSEECSRCGASSKTTIAALGHSYSLTSSTTGTCSVAGSENYTCSKCGDSYSVSTGTTPHDFSDFHEVVSPAGGITDQYYTCSKCGARQ